MIKTLRRWFGLMVDTSELDRFEPVYGMTMRSRDEWLSRNPKLKKDYNAKLLARSQRIRPERARRKWLDRWTVQKMAK